MRLAWAILCDEVRARDDGGPVDIVGAGIETTIAPEEPPPWGLPICIATCVTATYEELQADSDHVFKFDVFDPSAQVVFSAAERVRYSSGGGYKDFPHMDIHGWRLEPLIVQAGDFAIQIGFDDQTPVTLLYRVFSV